MTDSGHIHKDTEARTPSEGNVDIGHSKVCALSYSQVNVIAVFNGVICSLLLLLLLLSLLLIGTECMRQRANDVAIILGNMYGHYTGHFAWDHM